ncbi:glycogen synthase GlgA [Dongia soli]|uniref:Glycogen synthase n=1 Tax=Dongia soli TaxID=600628 RepID=A0ABU5E6W4_9PROT|nr:glycogen synthase GlgA [Dongia soli]MDY0881617.1 glycogen synthase GlgA [Dongia soli]
MTALTDEVLADEIRQLSDQAAQGRILYVTSEIEDYVKTGGLGEVSAALPRTLLKLCDIRVLLPGYREVLARHPAMEILAHLPAAAGLPACSIGRVQAPDGLILYIVRCDELYTRDGTPYQDSEGRDWQDNDIRFARLSLAAAEIGGGLSGLEWTPNFVHLNDWPSALTSGYLNWRGINIPTMLTIHNLAYQGLFDYQRLRTLDIPQEAFQVEGVEFYGRLSFLKAGIFYASHITTVSSTYAEEITSPEFGCGLDGLLRKRAQEGRLSGILNGIDESWEPKQRAGKPLRVGDWASKRRTASRVRQSFGLAVSEGPLFAIVSRLVHQKGVDLVLEAADRLVEQGGQLVVTGRGEPQFEAALKELATRHPKHVGVKIGFQQHEATRMFAGSDFLLMPSRFEPCGLSQMYAQRFGSLPIAHKTGGLADTIEDGQTGFLFAGPTLPSFFEAIKRGLDTFASSRRLNKMRRQAMTRSFSWQQSALRYQEIYNMEGCG